MDRHILASIYEIKGHKDRVAHIYREILRENPSDRRAEEALRRLATREVDTSALNADMYNFFIKAKSEDELVAFERWLIGD